ncbi:MAG TPA: enoyl-CoA hydratase/isomerase family protein, partial [Anaerolineales bacterium]|nr:enoyl-CoA hydratase/isomerase family protein [Anaerolineales bacterium]
TLDMLEDVAEAIVKSDEHPNVRAIIVRAEGPVFSAGIDLMALAGAKAASGEQNPARWARRLAERLQNAMNLIEATELPIIGALHGQVLGLGLELALAFDLRVATESCQFRMPEVGLGIVADVGGTTRLSRIVGPGRAKDMLMTGRSVDAQEAFQWGLVNRVVAEEELHEAAVALAQEIAANAPLAVGLFKRIIDQGDGLDKSTQMALERWAQSQLLTTEDVGEALTAFLQKRKPGFKGK